MTRARRRGFVTHHDCMIQLVIIAIIAAIAIPQFVRLANQSHRDCLRRLVTLPEAIAGGAPPPACPHTEQAYRKKTKSTGEGPHASTTVRWRCPDEAEHLGAGVDHVLVVRDGAAVPHATYPELERFDGGPEVQDDLWSSHTELHDTPEAVVVRQSVGNLSWLLAWAVVVIGAIVAVVFVVMLAGRLTGASWADPDVSLGCLLVAAVALPLAGQYALGTCEVRIHKQAPVVTVQNHYWLFSGGVTEVRNPVALWLPPNLTQAEVLHTDADGEPAQTPLFHLATGGRGVLGPLHETLFGAGTVHRPAPRPRAD